MLAKQLMCYPVVSGHLCPQLCCMRLPLLVLVFVCLCVCFFSACLLSDAPGGAKAGFPTEALGCRRFCFYRCSSWLSGFSFYFCSVSFSLLFLFPCPPVRLHVKKIVHEAPGDYLHILDSAYGTVQDGNELYRKFLVTFQNTGEEPSAYLQRLQASLSLAVKRGGASREDFDKHLLTQFCRGCWDNSLMTDLQLTQKKSNPPSFPELLLLLRTEEDQYATKEMRRRQHFGPQNRK